MRKINLSRLLVSILRTFGEGKRSDNVSQMVVKHRANSLEIHIKFSGPTSLSEQQTLFDATTTYKIEGSPIVLERSKKDDTDN